MTNSLRTLPEVFIVESLSSSDGQRGRADGFVLAQHLRLIGKKPKYYECRTRREFKRLLRKFAKSGYRYLHLSTHGNDDAAEMALSGDDLPYSALGEVTSSVLNDRHVFIPACHLGNEQLARCLWNHNPLLRSVVAPRFGIRFDHACAIFIGMYSRLFTENRRGMRTSSVTEIVASEANLHEVPFFVAHRKGVRRFEHEHFGPALDLHD